MRILSTKQIRDLDAHTIRHEPIASIDLMERASRAFADWFFTKVDITRRVGVVCGTGNNGGDGLAVARMLRDWGYPVKVWIVSGGVPESADFRTNRTRLPPDIAITEVKAESDDMAFDDREVIIDALFGSGLSRAPEGIYALAIRRMNAADAMRVALDMPSGLMADAPGFDVAVEADFTATFQLPKLAFMLPGSYRYTGEWEVVDIGLDRKFIRQCQTSYYYTTLKNAGALLKKRSRYDHKGNFGHALLVAGSFGKMGAAVLAARAALRAGLGLLTLHVPRCGYGIVQTAVPEAMAEVDYDDDVFSRSGDLSRYQVLGIGPGLGQNAKTRNALEKALADFGRPAVLDADALNLMGADRSLFRLVAPGSILTPHPKEFERLTGRWKDDFERLEMQKQLAVTLKSVIVLKGAHTAVADPSGNVHFNASGNPGMATGGTGDVLTGILTALLAQDYTPLEAAISGVYLHGLAGDLAVSERGMDAMIASDLIEYLPSAFLKAGRK